ncbi:MAG TPA: bifunctional precorrin-2 dehydrogenase/sirohydrochlorin ferrochelatase [Myxococcaceae bacterium]|jgi:precorrin-2 dehydrogenase/sirohydrochlorin ferrochelatase|nr:bifunctional precorrin-2 dehydrogenase/sirohydrochlorin ferrochelatase [Myxococcaceae bacterium]
MKAPDFPISMRLEGRPVLLVGGGAVAEGRARQLVEARARVHLVAPEATPALERLAKEGAIAWSRRCYQLGDCRGATLVLAAIDDPEASRAVAEEARALGIPVNVADAPPLCDFHLPAVARRGLVTIAVSTAGEAPALAAELRARAQALIGPEYATLARLFGRLRRITPPGPRRRAAFRKLIALGAVEQIRLGDRRGLWRLVRSALGASPVRR